MDKIVKIDIYEAGTDHKMGVATLNQTTMQIEGYTDTRPMVYGYSESGILAAVDWGVPLYPITTIPNKEVSDSDMTDAIRYLTNSIYDSFRIKPEDWLGIPTMVENFNWFPPVTIKVLDDNTVHNPSSSIPQKCQCGSHSVGSNSHSSWCNLYSL